MKTLLLVVNVDWFFKSHRLPVALEAIKQGYKVHLACLNTGLFNELTDLGIVCHDLPFSRSGVNLKQELILLLQLRKLIKKIKPDVTHTVTIKPGLYVGLIAKTTRVPAIVFAISGLGLVFSSNSQRLKRVLVKMLYRSAFKHENKKIIFQNPSDRNTLLDVLSAPESVAEMIKGSGADLNDFAYIPEPDVTEHNATLKVVMAARLLKDKGVYDFVECARIFNKQYSKCSPTVEFVLVGAPDLENPMSVTNAEFESWKQSDFITVLGARNDVANIFQQSHIVVLPSYYGEGLPKVLIEAAACGRPVITTDNPGCLEAVIKNETALIVNAKQPKEIAEAVWQLVNNPEQRQKMGQKGREMAIAEFDVRSVAQRHIEIYQSVMLANESVEKVSVN